MKTSFSNKMSLVIALIALVGTSLGCSKSKSGGGCPSNATLNMTIEQMYVLNEAKSNADFIRYDYPTDNHRKYVGATGSVMLDDGRYMDLPESGLLQGRDAFKDMIGFEVSRDSSTVITHETDKNDFSEKTETLPMGKATRDLRSKLDSSLYIAHALPIKPSDKASLLPTLKREMSEGSNGTVEVCSANPSLHVIRSESNLSIMSFAVGVEARLWIKNAQ